MSAQETHFQGAEILQSTRTHGRWTLQKLSAPISFPCHQCGRATKDTVVAIKTTSAGRKLAHCADCHLHGLTNVASAHKPHAPVVGTASAPDGAEGAATSRPDETVLIRQPDPGQPHDVVETASELQWTFVIRRHHVEHGQCPLPSQAARRIRTAKVVHLDHGRGFPTVLLDSLRKKVTKEHLRGIRWPGAELMPGTRITAKLDRSRLRLSLTPLERPVFIGSKRFSYAYDPRIIARELPMSLAHSPAGIGVSLDVLVQETIRKLGYLDESGSALLPVENLIRGVRSRGTSHPYSSDAIRASVNGLINRSRLTWETGSCAADGVLHFPARPGERTVRLVCYTPFVLPKPKKQRVVHLPSASSQHGVAGHLMKIEHLGKQASVTAQAAYAEAHRSAGLTGTHQLPKGHTYVKPHERGGLT
ncbi:hypothetical protein ACWCQF_13135 [Streptomyces rubiginosohelvolus]|uniref:hypothetical protein n=1 Tax=Streptomyces TaxID=1883 RepID=UPI00117DE231|nr:MULTISPECIES: hypothetical protein [unclassified Streptomyces]MBK3528314.1 hypothetical protein [Streptomyces sp. MBT72]MBK3537736.1 hypothetical protein [Streptomyces sp. MBT67]MBK3552379.1 hypothetical protein [Streptomyces sp. MBT61]MBK6027112.1 hypothetical protein [Streptomyces sp. MBT59]